MNSTEKTGTASNEEGKRSAVREERIVKGKKPKTDSSKEEICLRGEMRGGGPLEKKGVQKEWKLLETPKKKETVEKARDVKKTEVGVTGKGKNDCDHKRI